VLWKTTAALWNYFRPLMRASPVGAETFATEASQTKLPMRRRATRSHSGRQNVRKAQLLGSVQDGAPRSLGASRTRFLVRAERGCLRSQTGNRGCGLELSTANVVTGRGVSFGPRAWPADLERLVSEIEVNKRRARSWSTTYTLPGIGPDGPTQPASSIDNRPSSHDKGRALEKKSGSTRSEDEPDGVTSILRFKERPGR